MLIENATLTRIDTPQAAGPDGSIAYTTGAAIAVRCMYDEAVNQQLFLSGVIAKKDTARLLVGMSDATIAEGMRLAYQPDGLAAETRRAVLVKKRPGLGLDHWEVYLQAE
jgi:hypothetical protein